MRYLFTVDNYYEFYSLVPRLDILETVALLVTHNQRIPTPKHGLFSRYKPCCVARYSIIRQCIHAGNSYKQMAAHFDIDEATEMLFALYPSPECRFTEKELRSLMLIDRTAHEAAHPPIRPQVPNFLR